MARKPQKRDNAYYLDLLRREHPDVHDRWLKGEFRSVAEARRAAGHSTERRPVNVLKSAWEKATGPERKEFLLWLRDRVPRPKRTAPPAVAVSTTPATGKVPVATAASPSAAVAPSTPSSPTGHGIPPPFVLATPERYLTPEGSDAILQVMARRRLRLGDVMREIGFNPLNASLGNAFGDGYRIQPDMIKALEAWLEKNRTA